MKAWCFQPSADSCLNHTQKHIAEKIIDPFQTLMRSCEMSWWFQNIPVVRMILGNFVQADVIDQPRQLQSRADQLLFRDLVSVTLLQTTATCPRYYSLATNSHLP